MTATMKPRQKTKEQASTPEQRFWLTTQYPPRERPDDPLFGVWLEHAKRVALERMRPGDAVFIYQMKGGPVRIDEDGRNACVEGRQGIVFHGVAAEPLRHYGDEIQRFEGRHDTRWCCGAMLEEKTLDDSGFVPRRRVNQVLGFSSKSNLRSIGRGGVRELTKNEYHALRAAFDA